MTRIIQADGELITFEIPFNKLAQLAFSGVLQSNSLPYFLP
jgi:hypothetical protein